MIRISQNDNPDKTNTEEFKIPIIQPSDKRLQFIGYGEGTIEVKSVIRYKIEEGKSDDGRNTKLYNPYNFQGYIFVKENKANIEQMHVYPTLRNQGIAKSFIESFFGLCKKYGVQEINGIVYKSAIDFWKHMGFDYLPYEGKGHRVNKKLSSRDIFAGTWGTKPYQSDAGCDYAWELEFELFKKADKLKGNLDKIFVIMDLLTHIENNSIDKTKILYSKLRSEIIRAVSKGAGNWVNPHEYIVRWIDILNSLDGRILMSGKKSEISEKQINELKNLENSEIK